jgi:aldose sugar dehydrogenase
MIPFFTTHARQQTLSTISILTVIALISTMIIVPAMTLFGYGQESDEGDSQELPSSQPMLKDDTLKVELVAKGLDSPTSMDFIDDGHLIVLQKKSGEGVLLSTNGTNQNDDQPVVIHVPVDSKSERGLLGIAIADSTSESEGKTFVFLYFTESKEDSDIHNRLYRYEWDAEGQRLTNPTLILDLPAEPGPNHDGGKLLVAKDSVDANGTATPDNYHLYAVIGDLNRDGRLQNFKEPKDDSGDTSVIFRLTLDGVASSDNPFIDANSNNSDDNLGKYFAYGIRNSFGMTTDPLTGTLWMTENGPANYDEINVVKPGFNSGWQRIIGPVETSNKTADDLVKLDGSHYADPVFSWQKSIGVTDIEFLDSDKLGAKYADNIFVGDFNSGNLYFFEVNESRTGIAFEDSVNGSQNGQDGLSDLVAHSHDDLSSIIFGTGFKGGITDIATGPDGYLYILTMGGQLYRIVPNSQ